VRLRHGNPLWREERFPRRARRYPTLKGTFTTDIVIVGGGITGAIAACVFSEAGVRVAVVEANRCGQGSTAASTALVMQEPDRDFCDLADRYGAAAARRIWHLLRRGTRDFIRTIRRLKIDCELAERDSIYFTLDRTGARRLQKEFRDRKRAGLAGRWLTSRRLRALTGIDGEGAILTKGNAEIHPLKACAGFLRQAERQGAAIFEQSAVRRITASRSHVAVKTARGTILAKEVLIATGYATREFKALTRRFRLMDTYVIATSPLRASMWHLLRRDRSMKWDTERPYHYLRSTVDRRLLVGGEDVPHRGASAATKALSRRRAKLLEFLCRMYPSLAGTEAAFTWEGLFAETPDGLPYIGVHRRYPRHLFALGYGGNGMTASFLASQLLLKRYLKTPSPDEALFAFSRSRKR
jgi:glycine/D-amino acid oxidase-like deaminating enzyme